MNKRYKARVIFIFLVFCLLYFVILFNLYLIQVKQNDFFKNLGNQQYNVTVSRYPARAEIFDRTGQPLALNKDFLSAFIMPKQLTEKEKLESFLKRNYTLAYKRLQKTKHQKNFMFIKRKLSNKDLEIIKTAGLKDIKFLKERGRFYPHQSVAQLVGLTDIDNKGLFGIELLYNDQLGGEPAVYSLAKDARSGHFHFKKETQKKGESGKPVHLTIDSTLQFLALQELADTINDWNAKEGSVVVMNPQTGQILVMASAGASTDNPLEAQKNKPVTDCYECGSIAKTFAALAALEDGVVTIDEKIDCGGSKTSYVDGRTVNTLVAHGILSFSEVVELSNNIGIAKVAKRLENKLYDHYKKLGFGKKTNIEFPGEQAGFVNNPSNWSKQSLISLSYGYEMNCTLLQIAQAFCLIARDGHPVQPQLILGHKTKNQPTKPLYKKETIDSIKHILENTALRGTAKRTNIKGYRVMSKTGTANLLVNGQYSPDHNIYTCAGIVEKDGYQRVIVTFVKEAQKDNAYASTVAAPLFKKVAQKVLIHDKIV